jgi:hypothetical protein
MSTTTGTATQAATISRPVESGSMIRIIVAGFPITIRERGRDFLVLPKETCAGTERMP